MFVYDLDWKCLQNGENAMKSKKKKKKKKKVFLEKHYPTSRFW